MNKTLANYPKVDRVCKENLLFFRIVGVGGQITDTRFNGWAIKPYTNDCILPVEVVKRLWLIKSAGIPIINLIILDEPIKTRPIPWGKVVLAGGALATGVVGLLVSVVAAVVVLTTLMSILATVGGLGLIILLAVFVDPAYVITLEDGTMMEIYSDVH